MKKPKHYLTDNDLYYNVYISKGKGELTNETKEMFVLISKNVARRFSFENVDERYDSTMQGLLMMMEGWMNFNEIKYTSALPYFSEICKRGIIQGLNKLHQRKYNNKPTFIQLDYYVEKEFI